MPLLLLEHLRCKKGTEVQCLFERTRKMSVERSRAGDMPMLEQARAHRDVGQHLRFAFGNRAYCMSELDASVPQRGKEALDCALAIAFRIAGKKDDDVDVRMRKQLSAAVAADG